jgi:hypothetical protein
LKRGDPLFFSYNFDVTLAEMRHPPAYRDMPPEDENEENEEDGE